MNEDEAKRDLVRRWLVKAWHDLAAAGKLAGGPDVYLDVAIYQTTRPDDLSPLGLKKVGE